VALQCRQQFRREPDRAVRRPDAIGGSA
jgi:hypothetical protein